MRVGALRRHAPPLHVGVAGVVGAAGAETESFPGWTPELGESVP